MSKHVRKLKEISDSEKIEEKTIEMMGLQRKKEKKLVPLRINSRTTIYVSRKNQNEKYAQRWRELHDMIPSKSMGGAIVKKEELTPDTPVTCTRCGRTLPASQFYKNKCASNGIFSWCKDCENNRRKQSGMMNAAVGRSDINKPKKTEK